jgi:hypothetical protein
MPGSFGLVFSIFTLADVDGTTGTGLLMCAKFIGGIPGAGATCGGGGGGGGGGTTTPSSPLLRSSIFTDVVDPVVVVVLNGPLRWFIITGNPSSGFENAVVPWSSASDKTLLSDGDCKGKEKRLRSKYEWLNDSKDSKRLRIKGNTIGK